MLRNKHTTSQLSKYDLNNLEYKFTVFINNCDAILVDNKKKRKKLDTCLKKTALLECKWNIEKKHRLMDLNNSYHIQEIESDEKLLCMQEIKDLG